MKRIGIWLVLCILASAAGTLAAQTDVTPPPKVLVITREFIKPGKSGSLHQKSESAFVAAMAAAKWPTHYFAMDSLSGLSRSLFFTGYDSFAAWEKDNLATLGNASLLAALDKAAITDGDLLTSLESTVLAYREDQSFHAPVNIAQMRYFDISRYKIRPGHEKEWDALVKLYTDNYGKADANAHWAMYQAMYGSQAGGVYLVLTPLKSLAEADNAPASGKAFASVMGEDGMKKIADLAAASIETEEHNLFMFSPKMSYPPDAWVAADPTFWKPKP